MVRETDASISSKVQEQILEQLARIYLSLEGFQKLGSLPEEMPST